MFLVGGIGVLTYLHFAARSWETSHIRPFAWVLFVVPLSIALMCLSAKETEHPAPVEHPGLFKELVREKNILKFFIAMILQWISLWMFSAFFVITFMALFGLTVERAVKAFSVFNASLVFFTLPAGLLAPRLGFKKRSYSGLVSWQAAILWFLLQRHIPACLY